MKTLFLIAALLMGVAARPALAQLVWQEGEATLSTGITIRGELYFQPDANALLFRTAGKWHTYPASQLQGFAFIETITAISYFRHFTVYAVPQSGSEETASLIFEELTLDAPVRLLQLRGIRARQTGRKYGLPPVRNAKWQTPQPWYVWIDGRFVAPDTFVETELSDLLANSPKAVQQWANTRPRPRNPKALPRWLTHYYREMEMARQTANPTIVTWRE